MFFSRNKKNNVYPCKPQFYYMLFFFICASVVSYVTFVLSLFVPNLPFFWCLVKAVLRNHYENTPIQIYIYIKKSPSKTETFQIKNSDIFFYISAHNIDF